MRPDLERRLAVLVEPLGRDALDGVREFESEPDRVRVDLGFVPVFSDERPLIGLAGLLDWRSSGRLSAILRSNFFSGAQGEQLLMPGERRWPVDRLVILGVGARAEFDEARARELATRCIEIATGLAPRSVVIALPSGAIERGIVEVAFDHLLDAISTRSVREPEPATPLVASAKPAEPSEPADAAAADEPKAELGSADGESSEAPAPESQPDEQAEPPDPEPPRTEPRWWVVADESIVARLRRVRSGPPRAARGGPSLHT